MSSKHDQSGAFRGNPFGILFILILLLGAEYGFRVFSLVQQHGQLDQARLQQAQNIPQLDQAREMQAKLEPLTLELLAIAKTNNNARRIVREFNIQWNPKPELPSPDTTPISKTVKSLGTAPATNSAISR